MLPEGYATLNRAILSSMRREWNVTMARFGWTDDWKHFRVRVGLRALSAVVTYGVEYNRELTG